MTVATLAEEVQARTDEEARRRLILEFVEEYRWEPPERRARLLTDRPPPTGDVRYDALLAALAEHLAYHDGLAIPQWAQEADRFLDQWWFPVSLPSVRAEALVRSPAAFRRRGIFIGSGALERA
jgi:hypothetical protein